MPQAFPDNLAYISAFHDLETGGLKGLMTVLRREMRARKVSPSYSAMTMKGRPSLSPIS